MAILYSYIRFSSHKQQQGDSVRRQMSLAADFCKRHHHTLDTTLHLRDLGVPAFKGQNAKNGDLARFLDAVTTGRVKPGDIFAIESIDRLSREKPLKALKLLEKIIEAGVNVVTLNDEQMYSTESIEQNPGQLFVLLGIMIRAHEESSTKSKRVSAAWNQKRTNAKDKPLTAKCPGWITLDKPAGRFIFNDHSATVLRICQMVLDGHGTPAIAGALNREHVPTMSRKSNVKHWHYSVIQHVIRSRHLLGEFQPCRMVNGRATPAAEPIANYYPAIIDEATFYRMQAVLGTRAKVVMQGRTGKGVANLFGRLLTNGRDGSTMILRRSERTT
jgi:DNA invertase Pin-like site-specific DNA recombinase